MRKTTVIKSMAVFAVLVMLMANVTLLAYPDNEAATAEPKGSLTYVSLGDSTVNGYGMADYYPYGTYDYYGFEVKPEAIYPTLLAEFFESQGYTVNYQQLALSTMRSMDLRYMLDDGFDGDSATNNFVNEAIYGLYDNTGALKNFDVPGYTKNLHGLREYYQDTVAKADVITYQFNTDFVYSYEKLLSGIMTGEVPFEDFEYFCDPELADMMDDANTFITNHITKLMAKAGLDADSIIMALNSFEGVIAATSFAIASYCSSFDNNMKYIFTNNPNAKVIVIESANVIEDFEITLGNTSVNVGELYGLVIDYCNLYASYISPYSALTYNVDITGTGIDTFAKEIINAETPADVSNDAKNIVAYVLLSSAPALASELRNVAEANNDGLIPADGYVKYDFIDGPKGKLTEFLGYVFSSKQFDLATLIDIEHIEQDLTEKVKDAVAKITYGECDITYNKETCECTIADADSTVEFTGSEMTILNVMVAYIGAFGALSHPDAEEHALDSLIIVSYIAVNNVLEKPAGYPAFMDYNTSLSMQEALEQYKDLSIKTVTDAMHEMVAYLDANWNQLVTVVLQQYFDEADETLDVAFEVVNQFKSELIAALQQVEQTPAIEALIQFLQYEQYTSTYYAQLKALIANCETETFTFTDAIAAYVQTIDNNWDAIMEGIATGELIDSYYQAAIDKMLFILASIDIDADYARMVAELQAMYDKIASITDEDIKAEWEQLIVKINDKYLDELRPQISEDVTVVLGKIQDIIRQIIGGDDPVALADEYNINVATLRNYILNDYYETLVFADSQVIALSDYLAATANYQSEALDAAHATLEAAYGEIVPYLSANDTTEPADLESFLLGLIDKAEKAIEDFLFAYIETIEESARQVREEADATETIGNKYIAALVAELTASVDKLTVVTDYIEQIAANPDEYLQIKDFKDKLIAFVEEEYPTDEEIEQMKAEVAELYQTAWSLYDKYYSQIPESLLPYVDKFMAALSETYQNIEDYDYAALKANIIGLIQSQQIEDAIAAELRAQAAKLTAAMEEADLFINTEVKEYLQSQVASVVSSLNESAEELEAFAAQLKTITVKDLMDKLREIVKSWFEDEPDLLALADNFTLNLALFTNPEECDVETFLLALIDKAQNVAEQAQAKAVATLDEIAGDIFEEAAELPDEAQAFYDGLVADITEAVDQVTAVSEYLRTVAANPDDYLELQELKDQIIIIVSEDFPTPEQIEKMRYALSEYYLAFVKLYSKYIDTVPAEYRESVEKIVTDISEIYHSIEACDYEELKAKIIGFFESSEIEDAISKALIAEAEKLEAKIAEIDACITDPEIKANFMSAVQVVVDELYDASSNVDALSAKIADFNIKNYMDKIREIVKSWFGDDENFLALAEEYEVPNELVVIITSDMPLPQKMARLSSYVNQFDLEAYLLSLVDKAEVIAEDIQTKVIGLLQLAVTELTADAFQIKTDAELYYESIVYDLEAAVGKVTIVSDLLMKIAADPDEYLKINQLKQQIIIIVENEYPTPLEIREMKAEVAELYYNIKALYDEYIDQVPEEYKASVEKLMADITEIYNNIENTDYEALKGDIIEFLESSEIEDAIAEELRKEASAIVEKVNEIYAIIEDPEIKANLMAGVDAVVNALIEAADEITNIAAYVYALDIQTYMDKVREVIKSWFGDEDAFALADNYGYGSTLTVDEDFDLKEYLLNIIDQIEAECKAIQAEVVAAVEKVAVAMYENASEIDAQADEYAEYVIGYCVEAISQIQQVVESINAIAQDPDAYYDFETIKEKLVAIVEENFPTDEQFDTMKSFVNNIAEILENAYEDYEQQIPEEYRPQIEALLAEIQEFAENFEELDPEEFEQGIIENIRGQTLENYITAQLEEAANELEKLEYAAIAYVQDPEFKAQILAEITASTNQIRELAAEIGAYGVAIAEIDLTSYFDEIKAEVSSWFEIDKEQLRESIEALMPEVQSVIDELNGVVPDEVLDNLRQAYTELAVLDRALDNMTDDEIREAIDSIDECFVAFFEGYFQYEIDVIEGMIDEIIDDIIEYIESTDFYKYIAEIVEQIKPYIDYMEQYLQAIYQMILQKIDEIEKEIEDILKDILDLKTEDIMKVIDQLFLDFEDALRAQGDNISAAVLYVASCVLEDIQEAIDALEQGTSKEEIKAIIAEMEAELMKAKEFDIKPYCQSITDFVEAAHEIRMDVTENGPNKYFVAIINQNYETEQMYEAQLVEYIKQALKSEDFQEFVMKLDSFLKEIEDYQFVFTGETNVLVKKFVYQYYSSYGNFENVIKPALQRMYNASDDAEKLRSIIGKEIENLLADYVDPQLLAYIEQMFYELYDENPELFMQLAGNAPALIDSVEQEYAKGAPAAQWLANHSTYNITWDNPYGLSYVDENVLFSTLPEYKGIVPEPIISKETVKEYVWNGTFDRDMDLIMTLVYQEHERLYTITWVTEDATYTTEQTYGSTPAYDYDTWGVPAKKDGTIVYDFLGWNTNPNARTALPVLPEVSGDATYYAIFEDSDLRLLTIHYVFSDMTEASPDYTAYIEIGSPYTVVSPTIDGYVVLKPVVTGVMDEDGQEVTVKYLKRA